MNNLRPDSMTRITTPELAEAFIAENPQHTKSASIVASMIATDPLYFILIILCLFLHRSGQTRQG